MPQFPDLERLLAESTFFPGLNARLAALPSLKRIAEVQLDAARKHEMNRVRGEHARFGTELHPEDRTFELADLEQQITHLMPKLTRGGMLLTLWSVLERSVKDVVFRAAQHSGNSLSSSYFRRRTFFDAAEDALLMHARVSAFPDSSIKEKLAFLASLRHTLIHHDGRLDEAPPNIGTLSTTELNKRGILLERDSDFTYIIPSEDLLDESVSLVCGYVHDLAQRVFNAVVPPLSEA